MQTPSLLDEELSDPFLGDIDAYELDALDEADLELFAEEDEGLDENLVDELESADLFGDELDEDAWAEEELDEELWLDELDAPGAGGATAAAVIPAVNSAVLQAMDADDADAFIRRIGGRLLRGARRLGQRAVRAAGPLLRRALPMVQRVAGMAGPWGRIVSAGIGAARGLASGRGLRGALAGAIGGAIPGIGGRLASAVLGGDGADDDAALDALADMVDAGEVDEAVATPIAAGLAARLVTRRGLAGPGTSVQPGDRGAWSRARTAERIMLKASLASTARGGQRIRLLRSIGRLASEIVRRERRRGAGAAARAIPRAAQVASRRVVARVQQTPSAGTCSRATATQRLSTRRQTMRRVPASAALRPPPLSPTARRRMARA